MEYMMTYGWAILAVMIVGAVIWRLGILDMGGAMPATATGFEALKPLLATCEIREQTWNAPRNGFTCQFLNGAGSKIRLRDINFTVNKQNCEIMIVDELPQLTTSTSRLIYHYCFGTVNCGPIYCYDYSIPGTCPGNKYFLEINPEQIFSVYLASMSNPAYGPCYNMVKNKGDYSFDIDITYDIDVGGIISTKHSTGRIQLTAR